MKPKNSVQSVRSKIPRNVIVVAFVALASGFGQDLISPILPSYLLLIGVSSAGIGLIDGLLQGATNVFRFVSGVLSDRLRNRKGLVFLGYALSSVARPLLAIAGSFGFVAALRIADGIGKGTKDAPRDALVADSAHEGGKGRAFGFQRLVDTVGSVIGPLTAAALLLALAPSLGTYRLIFLLSAVPGAIALALIVFGVREPEKPAPEAAVIQRKLPLRFWLFVVAATIGLLTKINDSLFLVRASTLGVSATWLPVVFAGFTLVYALLSYPLGAWSDRIGKPPLIVAGWLTLGIVELGFSFDAPLAPTFGLFALYGLFYALTEGSARAFIAEIVPSDARGSAFAVYYTLTGVAVIVGGYGLGHLWDVVSSDAAFRVAAIGSMVAAVLFAGLIKRRPEPAQAPSALV
ncbi:MAG: MFS transporter [Patescibacteria group bacterium]|nr:MFS transporter [Patescibacteria group bacterium]